MIIVDAHEDLAWNSLTFGREYMHSIEETRESERGTEIPRQNGDCMIGWPQWIEGGVGVVFATMFAGPAHMKLGDWETLNYTTPEEANRLYWNQLDHYHRWIDENQEKLRLLKSRPDLDQLERLWQTPELDDEATPPVGLVILMEGADGVRDPEELEAWREAGVRIIGLSWSATRFAGGTAAPGPLTDEGRSLLEAMAALGFILDLSHLSDEGVFECIDRYPGAIIASHCNPRALLEQSNFPERHLSDDAIRRLAERGGVMGTVLGNAFLKETWRELDPRQEVTLQHVVAAIDHVCQLVGSAQHVALGSDFDGGFGLSSVPAEFNSIADLGLVGESLREHGYQMADVEAILGGNWLRLLHQALPND